MAFDILVIGNTGFDLTFASQNQGRLKHRSQNDYVGYHFYLSGREQTLSGSARPSATPGYFLSGVNRYMARVSIGEVRGHLSGHYDDYITVTVTAH